MSVNFMFCIFMLCYLVRHTSCIFNATVCIENPVQSLMSSVFSVCLVSSSHQYDTEGFRCMQVVNPHYMTKVSQLCYEETKNVIYYMHIYSTAKTNQSQ